MYFIVSGPMLPAAWSQLRVHEMLSDREEFTTQVTAGACQKQRSTLGLEGLAGKADQMQTPIGL